MKKNSMLYFFFTAVTLLTNVQSVKGMQAQNSGEQVESDNDFFEPRPDKEERPEFLLSPIAGNFTYIDPYATETKPSQYNQSNLIGIFWLYEPDDAVTIAVAKFTDEHVVPVALDFSDEEQPNAILLPDHLITKKIGIRHFEICLLADQSTFFTVSFAGGFVSFIPKAILRCSPTTPTTE